jgi:hypothetical protein
MSSRKDNIKEFYESFVTSNIKKKKDLEDEVLYKLFKVPSSEKNEPKTVASPENMIHQADILYLPDDDGKMYALVVTDTGTRLTDAEPLTDKSASSVLEAFKKIYKRGILKNPSKLLQVDAGTEFKGVVKKYFTDMGVNVRVAKAGRHRQQASVEAKNHILGKALLMRQTAQELNTGEVSREWVEFLPKVLKAMNKRLKRKVDMSEPPKDERCSGDECRLLAVGTKVRVILDEPRDVATGKKLHGKFRAGDVRWSLNPTEITRIIIAPDQPPMYAVKEPQYVNYTKQQLQVVSDNENMPPASTQRKFIVESILDKRKEKGRIQYLVKWKGYHDSHNSWESRVKLIEDVPEVIRLYENNTKEKAKEEKPVKLNRRR